MFHGNIKSAISYCFRSIYMTFDDSVKSQIDLDLQTLCGFSFCYVSNSTGDRMTFLTCLRCGLQNIAIELKITGLASFLVLCDLRLTRSRFGTLNC